jgi:hypothetical protein
VNDADPLSSVPPVAEQNAHPLDFGYFLAALLERADLAVKRGDTQSAVRYYLALASAAPQSAVGFRKLCETYQRANMHSEAVLSCENVLTREGVTVADSLQYLQLVLTQPEALSAEQVASLDTVIDHLSEQTADKVVTADLCCRLASRMQDSERLQTCVDQLHALHVVPEQASVYSWSLAMQRGDRAEATRQLALVQRTNIERGQLARMTNLMEFLPPAKTVRYLPQLLAAVLVATALAASFVMKLRRRPPRRVDG